MNAYYRNKRTGEIKDIVQDSPEMYALQQERDPLDAAQPLWEQTSFAHAQAAKVRAADSDLRPEDLGKDHSDRLRNESLVLSAEGVGAEIDPHLALTPGEIEAGLTADQKREDLAQQFEGQGQAAIQGTYSEAAEAIRGDVEPTAKGDPQPARGQTSRAGGSDERQGAPVVTAPDEGGSGSAQSGAALSSGQGTGGAPVVTGGPASGDESDAVQ